MSFFGIIAVSGLIGVMFGIALMCYEDGKPFALYRKIRCGKGVHRKHVVVGKAKVRKYFCPDCGTPRKFPEMKLVHNRRK